MIPQVVRPYAMQSFIGHNQHLALYPEAYPQSMQLRKQRRHRDLARQAHHCLCCCILDQLNLQGKFHAEHIAIVISFQFFISGMFVKSAFLCILAWINQMQYQKIEKGFLSVPCLNRLFSFLGQFTLIALLFNPRRTLLIPNCLMFLLNIDTAFLLCASICLLHCLNLQIYLFPFFPSLPLPLSLFALFQAWTNMVLTVLNQIQSLPDQIFIALQPAVFPCISQLTCHVTDIRVRQALREWLGRVGRVYDIIVQKTLVALSKRD